MDEPAHMNQWVGEVRGGGEGGCTSCCRKVRRILLSTQVIQLDYLIYLTYCHEFSHFLLRLSVHTFGSIDKHENRLVS